DGNWKHQRRILIAVNVADDEEKNHKVFNEQLVSLGIDLADKLAQEGNLDAAKTAAKKLFDIRNVYHKKYK
ncbi:cytochrome b562, partial [Pasteurella multocida]